MAGFRQPRWAAAWALCGLLTACGGGGGSDSTPTALPSSVTINSASQSQVNSDARFTTSVDTGLQGLRYQWNFGDGSTSTEAQPSHRYATSGSYTVTVTVTNEAGAARTSTMTVQVGQFTNVANTVCTGASQTGWCWQQPKPTGQTLSDYFFLDSNTAWAVGEGGAILKTTDGGATWNPQRSGSTSNLWRVRFADANNGWALGAGNLVLHTTDGGAHWQAQAAGYNSYVYSGGGRFWAINAQQAVYAPAYASVGYYTTDGGDNWQAGTLLPTTVTANGTLFAQDYLGVKRSTDLGRTTTQVFTEPLGGSPLGLSFADDQRGLIVSNEPLIPGSYSDYTLVTWRTADAGTTWTRQLTNLPNYTTLLKYNSDGVVWAYGYPSLYRSTDHGTTWAAVALPTGVFVFSGDAISVIDSSTLYFTYNATLYMTRDAGATWTTMGVAGEQNSAVLLRAAGNDLWLGYSAYSYASTPDRLYHSSDAGTRWNKVIGGDPADAGTALTSVWFSSASQGIAVGNNGSIMKTSDGGSTWSRLAPAPNTAFSGSKLQFRSATTGWLLSSNEGRIYKTQDGGATWSAPLTISLYGVTDYHFIDDTQGWAIAPGGSVYRSTDGGQSWSAQSAISFSATAMRFVDTQRGLAVGPYGVIALTQDGGLSWRARASGVSAGLNKVVWADASTAWAVGDSGTVIKSSDAGLSWAAVPVPTTNSLLDIQFIDANHGWIVGGNGTVITTADGGKNWRLQVTNTSRAFYSVFFTDAQTGWLVGTGGTIMATATGGN